MQVRDCPTFFLALVLAVLAAGRADASDPEVEKRIAAQDRLIEAGDKARLVREAQEAVSRSDTAINRFLLGRAFGLSGDLDKAREQFDWAMERDPACAYAYLGLGIYHVLNGDPAEGEKQLKLALSIEPRLSRAHTELGKVYFAKGDRLGAEREFQAVLAYEPENTQVRNLLAHQYLRDKRYDRAAQEFRAVLALVPEDRAARKGLALGLAFQRKSSEAIREFERVLTGDSKDLESYVFLKNLYLAEKNIEAAVRTLKRLIQASPKESPYRKEAEQEIERIGKGTVPGRKVVTITELLEKLDSENIEERREAMRVLVSQPIIPPPKRMVKAVTDSDLLVRVLAVKNIGVTGGLRAIGLLEVLLLHPKDRDTAEEVRGAAARGLLKTGSGGVIPFFFAGLADESLYVYRLCVESLREMTGMYFTEEPGEPITAALRPELTEKWLDWWGGPRAFSMKLNAIEEIEKLKTKRLALYLLDLLADPERTVAVRARAAFESLTGILPGESTDLDTPAGRMRMRAAAAAALKKGK